MKKEERVRGKSRSSEGNKDNRFLYFNEEWNTESPSDDDKGITQSDEDGYIDGIDVIPTPKKEEYDDDSFDY